MRFSERIGKTKPRSALQRESMDEPLRNRLWNVVATLVLKNAFVFSAAGGPGYPTEGLRTLLESLWHSHLKQPVDSIPQTADEIHGYLRRVVLEAEWFLVYDFLEFLLRYHKSAGFRTSINVVLEQEMAAYRVLEWTISPITDPEELRTIESSMTRKDNSSGSRQHLDSALRMLSDRTAPDYRNSVKESISAIASTCQMLTGSSTDELGKTLKVLETKAGLHGALKSAFSSIYGYTSDAQGIRHSMLESASVTFDDAYFFLVISSGFIHYLLQKFARIR